MRKASLVFLFFVLGLSACATVPVERKSPCACDWQPINQNTEKAVS